MRGVLTGLASRPLGEVVEDMGEPLDRPPLSLMPAEYLTPAAEKRAVEVQRA
jgi:hypothetical protein